MCLHQHPVGYNDHTHTPECSDFCIVKWNEDPPCKVVGVSNFKNYDKDLKTSIKEVVTISLLFSKKERERPY